MPATVIVKPQPGDEVTSIWGTSVADALNGIQAGTVVAAVAASGVYQDFAVTFPRPYVATPVIVAGVMGVFAGVQDYVVDVINYAATGFTLRFSKKTGATLSAIASAQLASWIAIGTPA